MLLTRFARVGNSRQKVFLMMKSVENGRFGLNIGGIEAELPCGPFGEVFKAKTAPGSGFSLHPRPSPPVGPAGGSLYTPDPPHLAAYTGSIVGMTTARHNGARRYWQNPSEAPGLSGANKLLKTPK